MPGIDGECRGDWHEWETSKWDRTDHQIFRVECSICHAGYMVGMVKKPGNTWQVDLKIFAAKGATTPSLGLRMDAMTFYGQCMEGLREEGFSVIQGNTVSGGPR